MARLVLLEGARWVCPSPFENTPQEFYTELKDVDRENEVNRILGAFKLNPFEQLGLRFDASVEDVRRAYRKVRRGELFLRESFCTGG